MVQYGAFRGPRRCRGRAQCKRLAANCCVYCALLRSMKGAIRRNRHLVLLLRLNRHLVRLLRLIAPFMLRIVGVARPATVPVLRLIAAYCALSCLIAPCRALLRLVVPYCAHAVDFGPACSLAPYSSWSLLRHIAPYCAILQRACLIAVTAHNRCPRATRDGRERRDRAVTCHGACGSVMCRIAVTSPCRARP